MRKKILYSALFLSIVVIFAAKFQDYTTKTTPAANDLILIADSADSNERSVGEHRFAVQRAG